jgi:hypothetical protein
MREDERAIGRDWWLLAGVWLFAAGWLLWRAWPQIGPLLLPDTDDAMRLVEVRDWFGGQAWGDLTQYRMHPPAGVPMHWSRIVDLPLAAVIALVKPIAGEGAAERVAVTLIPLLTFGTAMWAAALLGLRLGGRRAGMLAAVFLPTVTTVTSIMRPLRIDHHGWQTTLLVIVVACLADPGRRLRSGVFAGLALTVSLAIGLETLPFLLIAAAGPVVAWWLDDDYKRLLQGFGAAVCLSLPVLYVLFVPTAARWLPYCDALAPAYLISFTAAGLTCALLPAALPPGARWLKVLASLALLGAAALATVAAYPQCALGPLKGIDPRLADWLRHISEARPATMLLTREPGVALGMSVFPVVGFVAAAISLASREHRARLGAWLLFFIVGGGAVLTVFVQMRATISVSALAAVAAAVLAAEVLPRVRAIKGTLPRILATAGLLIGLSGAGALAAAYGAGKVLKPSEFAQNRNETKAKRLCNFRATLLPLNQIPPATLANVLNMGPALLLHTHHRVIGGPYHRDPDMLVDNERLWRSDDKEARAILDAYGADYVLACAGAVELNNASRGRPHSLAAELKSGEVPDWLEPVPMPKGSPLSLYKIRDRSSR